jgi:putative transposase
LADATLSPNVGLVQDLAAVLDWASRRVLSWRVSITLEAAFCVEALEEALAKHGKPEIFNTDSQKIVASSWAVCLKH